MSSEKLYITQPDNKNPRAGDRTKDSIMLERDIILQKINKNTRSGRINYSSGDDGY